jgi:hypothetical protein
MHYFPGAGDPFDWPMLQFDQAVRHIETIVSRQRGEEDDPMQRVLKRLGKFMGG